MKSVILITFFVDRAKFMTECHGIILFTKKLHKLSNNRYTEGNFAASYRYVKNSLSEEAKYA